MDAWLGCHHLGAGGWLRLLVSAVPVPRLAFRVTVEVWERDERYMATADLGEESRGVGVGVTAHEALREALGSLSEPYASEMAEAGGLHTVRSLR